MEGQFQFNPSDRVYKVFIVLAAGVLLFLASEAWYHSKLIDNQVMNQVTVTGEGKVYAKADIATIALSMHDQGSDVKTITSKNVSVVNKLVEDIKKLGVDANDIQTTQYSVSPQYNYTQNGGTVPNGYSIDQTITVKVRDLTKVGDVINTATSDGVNTIGALQFTIDDMEKIKEEARAKAIAQAKENAKNLEKDSGIRFGKLMNVYENYNPYPVSYYSKDAAMGMGGAMMGQATPAPDVQVGQQEVTISVSLSYQVR